MQRPRAPRLPTVRRLPAYLSVLRDLLAGSQEYVSATQLGEQLGIEPIVARKDLASTGAVGTPRVGFRVDELVDAIERALGWNEPRQAFLVGVGAVGTALLSHRVLEEGRIDVVAAFDTDPSKVGTDVQGHPVLRADRLPQLARTMGVLMGILAVPPAAAQSCADMMVEGGIQAIWNFAPVRLRLPPWIVVHSEDLSGGLAVLSVGLAALQNGTDPGEYED